VGTQDWRAVRIGAVIAVVASVLLTVIAASLESTVNGPGRREIAEPILWALGGGLGMTLGGVFAAWVTRRMVPGALAALFGAAAFLVLVILAYNSKDLRLEDQVVGTLLILVLPAYMGALLCSAVAAMVSRLAHGESALASRGARTA
jgi:hypothetical protein